MSMNLKPAIRYQIREYLIGGFVFWAVNAVLIALCFTGFLAFGPADDGIISYNGYGIASAVFAFVYGIVLPRQAMRLCAQMGVSRRTTFLSMFLTTALGSLCLSVAGELLLAVSRMAARTLHFSEQFFGLFNLVYPDYSAGLSQHTMPILYTTVAMLTLFTLGLFFTFLFWRLNKVGCIIAALAIPVVLTGVPALVNMFQWALTPVIAFFYQVMNSFMASPWIAMGLLLIVALVFSLISWMLIRRTNIRVGSLAQK